MYASNVLLNLFSLLGALILLLTGTTAQAQVHRQYGPWQSSRIGGGGYLQQVHFCPTDANRLYMTSDVGGVFRSDDLGNTWHMLHGTLPPGGGAYEVRGLLVDPADADHLLIACGSDWYPNRGIYVSRDGGKSWKQTLKATFPGNGDNRNHGLILVASPRDPNLLLAAALEGVFRSEDMGQTWHQLSSPTNLFAPSAIVFDRSNPRHVWLCIAAQNKEKTVGLFVSDDGGITFGKLSDRSPSEFVQDPTEPGILYGLVDQRPARSTDGGATWAAFDKSLPAPAGARDDGTYAAIAAGPDLIVLGGHGGTFYRLDKPKQQWVKIPWQKVDEQYWWGRMRPGLYNHFGSALGYIAINPRNPSNWFFTDWYACYVTYDAGETWKLCIDGVEMTVIHTVVQDPFDPNLVHVGMADLGYFRSIDGGAKFDWNTNGISNNIKCIATTRAMQGRLYAVGPKEWQWYANQVFVSDDSGRSWHRCAMKGMPDMSDARCNTISASPANGNEVYLTVSGKVAPDAGGVYRSTDAGNAWQWIGQGLPTEQLFRKDIWIHGPELAASGDGTLVAISCDHGAVFRRQAQSTSWSALPVPAHAGGPNAIVADPSTPGCYYLAMKEGGLYRTADAGTSWNQITTANVHWVAVDARNAQRVAAITADGAILSMDTGKTWARLSDALPYRHARNEIAFAGDRILVGTGGNGVFWMPLPGDSAAARLATPVQSLASRNSDRVVPSLVRNGDMSAGATVPDGWDLSSYRVGKVGIRRDASVYHSAPAALLIETQGNATSFANQLLSPFPTGQFRIHGYAKAQGQFKTAQIALQVFDTNWKQIDWRTVATLNSNGSWQEFSATQTLPARQGNALIGVSFEGSGKIWLDDVSVTTDAVATEVMPHPPVASLPVEIPPGDTNLAYIGRFDTDDAGVHRCAWSNSTLRFRFDGTDANVRLRGAGRVQVVVDGKPTQAIELKEPSWYKAAAGLPAGEHTVEIVKATEPIFGELSFGGVQLSDGARLLPVPNASHRLQIVGDSISAGYGNEAANEKEHFNSETENAWFTYGAIAAREFKAELHCIAWSGRCLASKNTLPEVYDRVFPKDPGSRCNASLWQPEAILINLGTNDFAAGNPDERTWVDAYRQFIAHLRARLCLRIEKLA